MHDMLIRVILAPSLVLHVLPGSPLHHVLKGAGFPCSLVDACPCLATIHACGPLDRLQFQHHVQSCPQYAVPEPQRSTREAGDA